MTNCWVWHQPAGVTTKRRRARLGHDVAQVRSHKSVAVFFTTEHAVLGEKLEGFVDVVFELLVRRELRRSDDSVMFGIFCDARRER